jgi:hypothetical protein
MSRIQIISEACKILLNAQDQKNWNIRNGQVFTQTKQYKWQTQQTRLPN